MPLLNAKKLRKLKQNPKAFFRDALAKRITPFEQVLNSLKPKKYQAYQKYAIISAAYNVEKYLEDYFKSFIHQRLDFKNNILLILVDDGSSDESASIIAKYQQKYPKNIIYLHKENGGQASARNLGLKYLEQKLAQIPSKQNSQNALNPKNTQTHQSLPFIPTWVSFTDPDDFLDRDCLYQIDKFLEKNKNEDLVMIGLNNQIYWENSKLTNDHPLHHYKFKQKQKKIFIEDLTFEIQTATCICFKREKIEQNQVYYDESMRTSEDLKFTLEFQASCKSNDIFAFLSNAKYYIRKRADNSSTMNNFLKNKNAYLDMPRALLEYIKRDNSFYAQSSIYSSLINLIPRFVGKSSVFGLSKEEQDEFLKLLDDIFSYIDTEVIINFQGFRNDMFHKIGILNCFKKQQLPLKNVVYASNVDPYKQSMLFNYFTDNPQSCECIINGKEEIYADYEKIVKYRFLDRVFCYEKRLWFHINIRKEKNNLKAFIDNKESFIGNWNKNFINIGEIKNNFMAAQSENLWLFIDRDIEADDNAEYFYRYVAENHPEQNIVFALDKNCPDWQRLSQEGFNLVNVYSKEFFSLAQKARNFISSHTPQGFRVRLKQGQRFIFLGHGADQADLSLYLNRLNITLRTSCFEREYKSLSDDFNQYNLSKKEVALTGMARHDSRLLNNKTNTKNILIMPTWRAYLAEEREFDFNRKLKNFFLESEYYKYWFSFLNNDKLKTLSEKYGYKIIFVPHFNMKNMLDICSFPSFIEVTYRKGFEPFANFIQNSDLLITDYSSVAFEMAYLGKSVLYYQFDKEEFFANHTYEQGYFSYENDGFGAVAYTEENLLIELENLLKRNCKPSEPYKSRIENTFELRDGKCCERIYKAILELDKPYKKLWTLNYVEQKAKEALEHKIYKNASERFKFILEHLKEYKQENKSFDEGFKLRELLYHFLLSSRLNYESKEAVKFIKEKGLEKALNKEDIKLYFEFVKNLIEAKEFQLAIQRLEELNIPRENQLEFSYLKLRVYSFLGDKDAFEKVYNELKITYNVSKENLELDLFLFQQELIKELSQPTGGGVWKSYLEITDKTY